MTPKYPNRPGRIPGISIAGWGIAILAGVVLAAGVLGEAPQSESAGKSEPAESSAPAGKASPPPGMEELDGGLIAIARPPFSDDIFPCSGCHAETDVVDRTRRNVDFHENVHFNHDSENRWCLDCHDAQNRDKLRLADGRLLDFTRSYYLCAQCHGTKFRDWKAGEHGRRTGSWSGQKVYLLCVHCHDPHSPKFKPVEPMPPPPRQETIQ